MTTPVSVLILNFNYGKYLREALNSVQEQSLMDYELVIADDGSTDNTTEIAGTFASRIDKFVTGEHVGLPRNLERGLQACDGELIAFLSADDLWMANHLEVSLATLKRNPDAALSYSLFKRISDQGNEIVAPPTLRKPQHPTGWIKKEELLGGNFISTQAVVLRRVALEAVGGVDPTLEFVENDLFLRIIEEYPIACTFTTTVKKRVHPNSLSRNLDYMLDARMRLYDKHLADADPRYRRRMDADAYLKSAYQLLARVGDQDATRQARSYLYRAIGMAPRVTRRPLVCMMMLATLSPRLFGFLTSRYRGSFHKSTLKLVLQRLVGRARS